MRRSIDGVVVCQRSVKTSVSLIDYFSDCEILTKNDVDDSMDAATIESLGAAPQTHSNGAPKLAQLLADRFQFVVPPQVPLADQPVSSLIGNVLSPIQSLVREIVGCYWSEKIQ
jgi:hypothetical protein